MSLFKNLTTDGLEENQDRVGGGGGARETDVYAGKIKVAYAGQSDRGAQNVTIIATLEDGREYRETCYVTNKDGKNFFLSKDAKNDDSTPKKIALPGFTVIDDLCQVSAGKSLSDMDAEDKVVQIYDYDLKKEMPKSVPVLIELTGKDILVAIKKSIVNKKGPAPDYAPIADSRDENTIEKVFHPELRVTVVEAKEAAKKNAEPVAGFIDAWLDKNRGKTHDKRTIKDGGEAGTSGRPGRAPAGGPPQAGATSARRSLFGASAAA